MDDLNDDKVSDETVEELKIPLFSPGYNQFTTQPEKLRGLIVWTLSVASVYFDEALARFRRASPKTRYAIRLLPLFLFLFIIGLTWNHHPSSIPQATTSLESEYYFWICANV